MRGSLIRTALRLGHEVIGQVRRDTALFALPPPREPGRRGRPRLSGARLDADAVAALPASVHAIAGYGGRSARLRHAVCRPRFLRGVIVRVVWCELERGSGWAKARLLLSTDPTLSAPAIVEAYSNRWSIEPLFRDLKMVDGLGAMWQRGRTTLLRWLHLVQIARTPADRKGRTADPRSDPPRRLAPSGDPDPRTGQGCTRGTLPEFRGFPPVARNLPEIGTCTLNRSPGKRRGCLNAA
jgi:hypothetical protein